ncbi:MAG: tyrosine-type recombinase/integrase [Pseudomonadota bacterium]
MYTNAIYSPIRVPWNKGKLVGQKRPLRLQEIWEIRFRLESENRTRDLAMFNLAIDSKLRACDLMRIRVADIAQAGNVQSRARVVQLKTGRPVQFEKSEQARRSVERWIDKMSLCPRDYLFPSRIGRSGHLTRRQYSRIVRRWVSDIGLDPALYGTHSMRRSKASIIYRKTKNIRAVQLLLGHTSLESTVRYLGIDEDDALSLAEQIEV